MYTLTLPHGIQGSLFLFTYQVKSISHSTSHIYFTGSRKRKGKGLKQLLLSSWPTANVHTGFLMAPCLHMHTVFPELGNHICRLYMKII